MWPAACSANGPHVEHGRLAGIVQLGRVVRPERATGRGSARPRARSSAAAACETDADTSTNSCTSRNSSAGFELRSCPIVDERSELMLPPQSEPATWPGNTSTSSGERGQPLERAEEILRTLARRDREVRARRVADEQRVAGQDELARRRGRRSARGGGRACAGRVIGTAPTWSSGRPPAARRGTSASASGWTATGEPVFEREPAVTRDVVGVRVRLEHALDPDALVRGASTTGSISNGGSTTTATPAAESPTR